MSAGSFTCAQLAEVQLKADSIWENASLKKDYVGKVEALSCIRSHQTVKLVDLEGAKDKTVNLIWAKDCDDTTTACGTECTVGGNELEAGCQTFTLDLCRQACFTVDEKDMRNKFLSKEDLIATGFLRKMRSLDEWITQQLVAKLDTFKGVNAYTGGKGTVAGFTTTVPAAFWNASLFAYFQMVGEINKFNCNYLLSGSNLFEAAQNAQWNSANADGKGAANMFNSMDICFDLFNMDSVLTPDLATFMLDCNAVAFVSKNYYPFAMGSNQANAWGGVGGEVGMKFQIESKNLPGVFYDVTYKITCVGNEIKHNFCLDFNGGIFRNPLGCNLNNTGILKFVCA